jgi:phosphohistidine phosphatase SixA
VVTSDELVSAVQGLIDLEDRARAQEAAERLPEHVVVADLLRAADGLQQLARALATVRRSAPREPGAEEYDPHDVRSLYS